jgi:hypothetical protein
MYGAGALIAASRGRFFEFADMTFGSELSLPNLRSTLDRAGATASEIDSVLSTLDGPPYDRLSEDEKLASRLGVAQTPTIISVSANGRKKVLIPAEFAFLLEQ